MPVLEIHSDCRAKLFEVKRNATLLDLWQKWEREIEQKPIESMPKVFVKEQVKFNEEMFESSVLDLLRCELEARRIFQ